MTTEKDPEPNDNEVRLASRNYVPLSQPAEKGGTIDMNILIILNTILILLCWAHTLYFVKQLIKLHDKHSSLINDLTRERQCYIYIK